MSVSSGIEPHSNGEERIAVQSRPIWRSLRHLDKPTRQDVCRLNLHQGLSRPWTTTKRSCRAPFGIPSYKDRSLETVRERRGLSDSFHPNHAAPVSISLRRGILHRPAATPKDIMTTPKRKRPKPYSYRPPKDKDQALKKMLEDSGLSFNAFVTEAIFGRSRHRPAETRLLARVLGQCGVMADRLREVMLAGPDNAVLLLEEIRDELRLIRMALMRLLGRRS